MKKLILTFSIILVVCVCSAQDEFDVITFNSGKTARADIYFINDSVLYFREVEGAKQFYKVKQRDIKTMSIDPVFLRKHKTSVGAELFRFSKQAQSGIFLSLAGSAAIVALPLVIGGTVSILPGAAMSLVGYIIWANSYAHTKRAGVMLAAEWYKTE
jgi:hypothetical protein